MFLYVSGSSLIKVGQTEQKLGQAHKEFEQVVCNNFLQPLKGFLDGDMKTVQVDTKQIFLYCNIVCLVRLVLFRYRHSLLNEITQRITSHTAFHLFVSSLSHFCVKRLIHLLVNEV